MQYRLLYPNAKDESFDGYGAVITPPDGPIPSKEELDRLQETPEYLAIVGLHGAAGIERDQFRDGVIESVIDSLPTIESDDKLIQAALTISEYDRLVRMFVSDQPMEQMRARGIVRDILGRRTDAWEALHGELACQSFEHCHPNSRAIHFLYQATGVNLLGCTGQDLDRAYTTAAPTNIGEHQAVADEMIDTARTIGSSRTRDVPHELTSFEQRLQLLGADAQQTVRTEVIGFGTQVQQSLENPLPLDTELLGALSVNGVSLHGRDTREAAIRKTRAAFRQVT